jgi:hypothetical protein
MLKQLAYGSVAVLCLSLAFHLGGVIWKLTGPGGWSTTTNIDPLPVPVSEVKLWDVDTIVTFDNVAWCIIAGGHWQDIGPWPQASTTDPTTWGRVKSEFR